LENPDAVVAQAKEPKTRVCVKDNRKKVSSQRKNHARKTKDFEKQKTGMTMRRSEVKRGFPGLEWRKKKGNTLSKQRHKMLKQTKQKEPENSTCD